MPKKQQRQQKWLWAIFENSFGSGKLLVGHQWAYSEEQAIFLYEKREGRLFAPHAESVRSEHRYDTKAEADLEAHEAPQGKSGGEIESSDTRDHARAGHRLIRNADDGTTTCLTCSRLLAEDDCWVGEPFPKRAGEAEGPMA